MFLKNYPLFYLGRFAFYKFYSPPLFRIQGGSTSLTKDKEHGKNFFVSTIWTLWCGLYSVESSVWILRSGVYSVDVIVWILQCGFYSVYFTVWFLQSGFYSVDFLA